MTLQLTLFQQTTNTSNETLDQLTQLAANNVLAHDLWSTYSVVAPQATLNTTLATLLPYCFLLFMFGALGMLYNYRNLLVTMMSAEMAYLGAISLFVLYGAVYRDPQALVSALLLLILAACESAVGLGVLVVLHRFGHALAFHAFQTLRG